MRGRRILDVLLAVLALGLCVSLVASGWHDVSQGYDVWYYHLPFAARLVGLLDPAVYVFSTDNRPRFEGFPLFAELLQGLFWRVTGHLEATSLVSLGALFAVPIALWRWFKAPPAIALVAFLAVPLVHIHATASYVDLPANAGATLLVLLVYRLLVRTGPPRVRDLVLAAVLAAATANSKFQLVPIVAVTAFVLLLVTLRRGPTRRRLLVFVLALPLVFATPIKNVVRYGNPVWPIELAVLGHQFPHVEEAYAQSPPHLASSSRPVRFVRSVLEIDNPPIATQRRWSLDQWAPPSDPSCRMGGYFGAYVVVQLAALVVAAFRRREARVAASVLAGVTVLAALVPQSHELRYYMHWMLLLVSFNLVLWTRERGLPRVLFAVVAVGALGVVTWSTDGGYLYPSGSSFTTFLAKRGDAAVIESITPGERICVARQPLTFLYAPIFHREVRYRLQEWSSDADCVDARRVP